MVSVFLESSLSDGDFIRARRTLKHSYVLAKRRYDGECTEKISRNAFAILKNSYLIWKITFDTQKFEQHVQFRRPNKCS